MKRVLFIDVRNTARSAMAEAWFDRLAAGWALASSGGTAPRVCVDPLAVLVMKEAGIRLHSHVPSRVTQPMLSNADVIVIMGADIYASAFAPTHIWNFQEPIGDSIATYRDLRDGICERVRELISEMRANSPGPIKRLVSAH